MDELRDIAFAHARADVRAALVAVWDYDATLGRIVASTTEPMIGQMRLTWWHERMTGLDAGEVAAEPVIAALAVVVGDHDVKGSDLAQLVEGWEVLLDPVPLPDSVLRTFAERRGAMLFALSARILGAPVGRGAGAGWALIDFATRCSDRATAERAWALAGAQFGTTPISAPKPLRILAQMAKAKAAQPFAQIMQPVSRWTLLRAVLP